MFMTWTLKLWTLPNLKSNFMSLCVISGYLSFAELVLGPEVTSFNGNGFPFLKASLHELWTRWFLFFLLGTYAVLLLLPCASLIATMAFLLFSWLPNHIIFSLYNSKVLG